MNQTEYETSRLFPQFIEWLDEYRNVIYSDPKLGHESIVRKNKIARRVFEEAWHIRPFIQFYFPSEDGDRIALLSGSQSYDAIISDAHGQIVHHIEVTQALTKSNHHERQKLADEGMHFSGFTNIADDVDCLVAKANELIAKKLAKKYPRPTTLIVALFDDVIFDNVDVFQSVLSRIRFPQNQETFGAMVFTTQNAVMHKLWGNPIRQ